MSSSTLRPIWTPKHAQALREIAERFPREVGQSEVLADILEREGLSLVASDDEERGGEVLCW